MERERDLLLSARAGVLGVRRDVVPGLAATLEIGALTERVGFTDAALRSTAALLSASWDVISL